MPEQINKQVVEKYFRNQSSESEAKRVLDWLSDPQNEEIARQWMESSWNESSLEDQPEEQKPMFDQLLADIHRRIEWEESVQLPVWSSTEDSGLQTARTEFPRPWYKRRLGGIPTGVAASLVLLGLLASTIFYFFRERSFTQVAEVPQSASRIPNRQPRVIRLPDGTKVWLNAGSTLHYPPSFANRATREVQLEGEAFFEVVENKHQPFIVNAAQIKIKVLGTTFNVRSYTGDQTVETTLVRGRVAIEKKEGGASVELKPNQQAIFTRQTNRISLSEVKPQVYTAWKSGSLRFEDETLGNVAKALERWYDVRIHLAPETNTSCRLNARIDQESLTETLSLLHLSTGVNYRIEEKDVYLSGEACR